jgi:hypothetical protein
LAFLIGSSRLASDPTNLDVFKMALIFSKCRPVSLSSLLWFDSLLPMLFNTCFWSLIPAQMQNNKIQKTAYMYTKSFKLLLLDILDVEQRKGAMVVGHLV